MHLADFQFNLPNHLIAQYPTKKRSASRLLSVNRKQIDHYHFYNLIELLNEGDLLVFNHTKVLPARLFAKKQTGGKAEVLIERVLSENKALAQVRVSKALRCGDWLIFDNDLTLQVTDRQGHFYQLSYTGQDRTILDLIHALGEIPLPPYMQREPDQEDKERYQTIYAKHDGSVAAPTAGLHFDQELMQRLHEKKIKMTYLTLHIGAGTFAPVRSENILEHKMHSEYCEVTEEVCSQIFHTKAAGKRVIAVGTTSMRALESAAQTGNLQAYKGETDIFIYPGYKFNCVDALITNFHLPCSTLLMLVCAFGGYQEVMHAYQAAITQGYRFYSYGDAMFVQKA